MRVTAEPNPIARDIQNVVEDAQDLMKTVRNEGEGKITEMRTKVQSQIDTARASLAELQRSVQDGARVAMTSTDEYVRANPWRAVGISAGGGRARGLPHRPALRRSMGLFGEARSIVGDVKGLASTGLRAVRTRLELLVIELAEEKAWIARFVVVAVAALYLVTFGLALAICALVLWVVRGEPPRDPRLLRGRIPRRRRRGARYIYLASRKRQPPWSRRSRS